MPNQLAQETSPYLLQHVDNPVDWYPWNEEALQKAQEEDKPILLSIGYAACHWCHVMAHESFEDPATAEFMNNHFVNVKVDREERPDLDSIYMNAVVAMSGQGGWPMTVFLTPEGKPFYGGTYFPPAPRHGMPSFMQVLQRINQVWREQREEIEESADNVAQHLGRELAISGEREALTPSLFRRALDGIFRRFDSEKGGFGQAPKFPPSMTLEFLLWMHFSRDDTLALQMAETTLQKMAYGGMYDQLGGGFARYATDAAWLVPHFEKMLYDNALLARVYLHAYQATGRPLYRRIVEETLDFVARDMRHEAGGFYSSYDADSEGEEGKFYVWTAEEVEEILGETADLFMKIYDVSRRGNWEGKNILNVQEETAAAMADDGRVETKIAELAPARAKLRAVRRERVWPGLDDKVLTAWNGLMLAAFAEAGRVLNRPDYTEIAAENAAFLRRTMRRENGRLLRTWKEGGEAHYNGYLEDYAYLADGLLALYQTTFDAAWFTWAEELAEMMLAHFRDEAGGFYDTSDDHEELIHRPKNVQDNATPSGNAMAVHVLLRLGLLTGNGRYSEIGENTVAGMSETMAQHATGFAHWLCAAAFILSEPREVAIVGDPGAADTQALLETVFADYRPDLVAAAGEEGSGDAVPLLAERPLRDEKATAYVCRRFVCQQPVTTPEDLAEQLA
jgi:hypothetical protein